MRTADAKIADVVEASGECVELGSQTAAAFPAVFTMHCPNSTTNACVKHARSIEGLFQRMWGMRVQATKAPEGSQCDNCVNEAKATGSAA